MMANIQREKYEDNGERIPFPDLADQEAIELYEALAMIEAGQHGAARANVRRVLIARQEERPASATIWEDVHE